MEVWKPVVGFEGYYEVSNLGRIKSLFEHNYGKIRAELTNLRGYKQILLRCNGRSSIHTVHKLVCAAFIGPRPEGYDINHKNGIKADNRVENLEYMTKSQNKLHSTQVLKKGRGESHGNAKINEDIVREIRRLGEAGLKHSDIAAQFGITRANTSMIIRRNAWKHVT